MLLPQKARNTYAFSDKKYAFAPKSKKYAFSDKKYAFAPTLIIIDQQYRNIFSLLFPKPGNKYTIKGTFELISNLVVLYMHMNIFM